MAVRTFHSVSHALRKDEENKPKVETDSEMMKISFLPRLFVTCGSFAAQFVLGLKAAGVRVYYQITHRHCNSRHPGR